MIHWISQLPPSVRNMRLVIDCQNLDDDYDITSWLRSLFDWHQLRRVLEAKKDFERLEIALEGKHCSQVWSNDIDLITAIQLQLLQYFDGMYSIPILLQ